MFTGISGSKHVRNASHTAARPPRPSRSAADSDGRSCPSASASCGAMRNSPPPFAP